MKLRIYFLLFLQVVILLFISILPLVVFEDWRLCCGNSTVSHNQIRYVGSADDRIFYSIRDTMQYEDGIYELNEDGFILQYRLDSLSYLLEIVDGKYLISKRISSASTKRTYYFSDIETGDISYITPIESVTYYQSYNPYNNTLIFIDTLFNEVYIYDIASNSYLYHTVFDMNFSFYRYLFYQDNILYLENTDYDPFYYTYDFTTSVLSDATWHHTIENPTTLFHGQIGEDIYQYSIIKFGWQLQSETGRYYDIYKLDKQMNQISVFEVPNGDYVTFVNDIFFVHDQNWINVKYDGEITIKQYDLNFQLIDTYIINTNFDHFNIITEELVEVNHYKTEGSIIKTYYSMKEVYSIQTGELVYASDWIKLSNQMEHQD